jgi:AcrR family transcriptional regulator
MTQEEREPEAPTTAAPAATQDDPEGAPTPAPRTGARGAATRERIVDAAAQLFYAQGLRAVSADRIIELAGITKVTFYRHFRTKDDLIVAYLERRAAWERDAVRGASEAAHGDVDETLRMVSTGIGAEACTAGFRGCPFINAAAELPDGDHPGRRVIETHRAWLTGQVTELLGEAGTDDAPARAEQLMMLRDGAMVSGYLGRAPDQITASLIGAGRAIIGR